MNINIPDKVYKLLILIGIFIMGYSYYKMDSAEEKYFSEIDEHRLIKDSLLLTEKEVKFQKENLLKLSDYLATKYDVKNPIEDKDSSLYFTRILVGPKEKLIVNDSIYPIWEDYKRSIYKIDLLAEKLNISNRYLDEEERLKKNYFDEYNELFNVGGILFIVGLILWMIDSPSPFEAREQGLIKQNEKLYIRCQSCGFRFNSLVKYGSNKDKSKNYAFCKKCYKNGNFTNPKLTKEEVIENSLKLIKKRNWITRNIYKYRIKSLERWDDNPF